MSKVKRISQLLERHVYRGQFDDNDDDDEHGDGHRPLKVLLLLSIAGIDKSMRCRSRWKI